MKMDSLDSLTYGGVRGRENLFNFPSYSIYIRNIHSINRACQRLENTSDSITKICLDSGFESQRTFNRVFKERYKISPSDYRSTCLKDMTVTSLAS